MAEMPVRFAITVYISAIYIDTGSFIFSPVLNATDGEVGKQIKSNSLKINDIFFVKILRTFCRRQATVHILGYFFLRYGAIKIIGSGYYFQ